MPLYRAGYTLGEIGERNAWPKSPGGREVEIDSKPHTVNQGNDTFRAPDGAVRAMLEIVDAAAFPKEDDDA